MTRSFLSDSNNLHDELLDSDAAYFRAAATQEDLVGFQLSYIPGLESLPAACVALPHPGHCNAGYPVALPQAEERLRQLGSSHARFYQWVSNPQLEQQFLANGYRAAHEIALLNTYQDPAFLNKVNTDIELRPVASEDDWALKLALHQESPHGPDGHVSDARDWLKMERMKCDAGYMEPFLIVRGTTICGAVNFAERPNLGRLKNLVIHPQWRSKRMGEQAARLIAAMAKTRGKPAAGSFAMEDGRALKLYQNAGYQPATRQTEWFKSLE